MRNCDCSVQADKDGDWISHRLALENIRAKLSEWRKYRSVPMWLYVKWWFCISAVITWKFVIRLKSTYSIAMYWLGMLPYTVVVTVTDCKGFLFLVGNPFKTFTCHCYWEGEHPNVWCLGALFLSERCRHHTGHTEQDDCTKIIMNSFSDLERKAPWV